MKRGLGFFTIIVDRKFIFTIFSLFQRALASPDPFNAIEGNFRHLQEAKSKLSLADEEKVEVVVQELRTRWEELKAKIAELQSQMQLTAENFSDFKDKLHSLVNWVEEVEQTCEGLGRVRGYNEFQPLMEKFQVFLVCIDLKRLPC